MDIIGLLIWSIILCGLFTGSSITIRAGLPPRVRRVSCVFSNLIVITNLPIGHYKNYLLANDKFDDYLDLLKEAYNPETEAGLMCRHQISCDWGGSLYDCDFHLASKQKASRYENIRDIIYQENFSREIIFVNYCYGCTAGAGSSCGGQLL